MKRAIDEDVLAWDDVIGVSSQKLLVIDDEARFRQAYQTLFERCGFQVSTASSATQANELLVRSRFDIVLLDIKMTEVDGSVLFGIIRTFHKDVKVVVSSVYSIDEQKERIKGADAYFDKSDGNTLLLGIIASLVTKSNVQPVLGKENNYASNDRKVNHGLFFSGNG